MNFSLENLFSALSGMNSGGTSAPYTPMSNPSGGMPKNPNPSMQSPTGNSGNFNPQGTWQGNQTAMQPQQGPQQGMGISGMFKDIMGRAPALYNAMQNKPGVPPMQSFFSGMNQGMRPNAPGSRY